jgi:hypothetical protein
MSLIHPPWYKVKEHVLRHSLVLLDVISLQSELATKHILRHLPLNTMNKQRHVLSGRVKLTLEQTRPLLELEAHVHNTAFLPEIMHRLLDVREYIPQTTDIDRVLEGEFGGDGEAKSLLKLKLKKVGEFGFYGPVYVAARHVRWPRADDLDLQRAHHTRCRCHPELE